MAEVMPLEPGALPVALAEAKAALRIAHDEEDALLAGHLRTALALCEAFTGQWLVERAGEQRLAADHGWQRLGVVPVRGVTGVFAGDVALPAAAWASDIGADGDGWVRVSDTVPTGAVARFRAGLARDWNGVPEPLRAGIVRLATHFYTHRDAADAGPPPAAVAALWRPWRRMRLG